MSLKFQKSDVTTSQDLGTGALDYTTSTNRKFRLTEVNIHSESAITETITIKRISAKGSDYDVILAKRDLVSEQDFIFRPHGDCDFQAGDEVRVQCTKNTATDDIFVVIKRKELP